MYQTTTIVTDRFVAWQQRRQQSIVTKELFSNYAVVDIAVSTFVDESLSAPLSLWKFLSINFQTQVFHVQWICDILKYINFFTVLIIITDENYQIVGEI